MKTYYFLATALVTFLLPTGLKLEASESFRLETNVYVFKNGDFQTIKLPDTTGTGENHSVVFKSPATAQFGQETLSLDGSHFAWSGGHNPPDRFSLIAAPTVPLTPGKPATLLSTVPVQYLEKLADGTLKVREIAGDSPEAPHWRLTFTIGPADETDTDLHLACDLDITTVTARENVTGVTLQVGKPVLAQFKEKLDPVVRAEEWSALLLRAPNGSDYSMLLLLKIAAGHAPATVAGAEPAGRPMTAAELDSFATFYYRHPQPELVARAIEALGPSGFVKDRVGIYIGFFAEVFAANPDRRVEWRKLIDRQQDWSTRSCLRQAMGWSQPGDILSSANRSIRQNDMYWGAFYASGNPAYLRRLAGQLRFVDESPSFWVGATAMLSLARNAPDHPLVRTTLAAVRTETDPRTREIIDELLGKDPETIRKALMEIERGPGFRSGGINITGER